MVLLSRRDALNSRITSRNKILATVLTSFVFLLIPIFIIILDPIQMIVNYKLRLAKGTILHNILLHEIPAARLSFWAFNVTNADRFVSGEDYKLKVEEVGPFVYQEYRWHEDLDFSEDGKYMGLTPRVRSEFVPEASIGYPKDINLVVPNLPFLSLVAAVSNYPSLVQYAFNILAVQTGATPFINLDVHSLLWGYKNPLITISYDLFPGLVYFDSFGLLDRLYDNETDFRIVVGATNKDRFEVKSVKKFTHILNTDNIKNVEESEIKIDKGTYEGGAYPPMLTPDYPITLFRLGICRTWNLEYIESRIMDYGGEALVYTLSNKTFINNINPVTLKTYPDGLMDFSECFYNLPFVLTKSHFLDCDPKLTERIDGLKPNAKLNYNEIVIDRKASVTFSSQLSMQVSMILDDVSYNRQTKKMSNSVLPIVYARLEQPKMTEGTMSKFILVYRTGPLILMCAEILSAAIGLAFLARAIRLMHLNRISRTRGLVLQNSIDEKSINSKLPLIGD